MMTSIMTALRPMPGRVVVQKDQRSERVVNGIVLLTTGQQSYGQVVAVYDPFTDPGDGAEVEPAVQVEDWVVFGQHAGVEIQFGGRERYTVLRETEILCHIDPEVFDG